MSNSGECIVMLNDGTMTKIENDWGMNLCFPRIVERIEPYSYEGHDEVENVYFSNIDISIGEGAFKDCKELYELDLGDSLTEIPDFCFSGCSELKAVNLPMTLKSIGDSAFEGCSGIRYIILQKNLTDLGKNAFAGCSAAQTITIRSSIKVIPEGAFKDCSSVRKIVIPEGVERIEKYAFAGCTKLEKIVIPATVTYIDETAFVGCGSLCEYSFGSVPVKGIMYVDERDLLSRNAIVYGQFADMEEIIEISIPNSVTLIGKHAFENCPNLKKISYHTRAIYDKAITDDFLRIGHHAFKGCHSLESINFPDINVSTFFDTFEDCGNFDVFKMKKGKYGNSIYSPKGIKLLLSEDLSFYSDNIFVEELIRSTKEHDPKFEYGHLGIPVDDWEYNYDEILGNVNYYDVDSRFMPDDDEDDGDVW